MTEHPHQQLGFEHHMPHTSNHGEAVEVVTPAQEQLQKARKILGEIRESGEDAVPEVVVDANHADLEPKITEEIDLAGLVDAVEMPRPEIIDALQQADSANPEVLAEAMDDAMEGGLDAESLEGVARAIDRTEQQEKEKTLQPLSRAAALLEKTYARPDGKVRIAKLDYLMPDAEGLLAEIARIEPLTPEQVEEISAGSMDALRNDSLSLSITSKLDGRSAEEFDKTQRDRGFFAESVTGGSGRSESYASELFAAAANPEIRRYVAEQLDGKTVLNLGGGNAKIAHELKAAYGVHTNVTNIEPYPSQRALDDPESDPIITTNPAKEGFMEQSGLIPGSADEILAAFSVPAYLETPQEVVTLFDNITHLLKPGGHARISHFGIVDAAPGDPRHAAIIDSLEKIRQDGYLIEIVKTSINTLILTAPEA